MAISILSDNILITIVKQLKRDSDNNDNLYAFIRVCRRWNRFGLPVFYANITISNKAIESFTNAFNVSAHAKLVRSLTLRIEKDQSPHPNAAALFPTLVHGPTERAPGFGSSGFGLSGPGATETHNSPSVDISLPERLENFACSLSGFEKLSSFSLFLEESPWRLVPRKTLIKILTALPVSCQNLELDTKGQDYRQESEYAHVCEAVRSLLPQMHNVRIRVGAMCGAMFGTYDKTSGDITPLKLPHIRSLVVNCALLNGMHIQVCGCKDYTAGAKWPLTESSWQSITASLEKLVENADDNLACASIHVVSTVSGDEMSQICPTAIRADLVNKEAWAFPALRLGNAFHNEESYNIRFHDGSNLVITEPAHVESIAEGQKWSDVRGGARLPSGILKTERAGLPSFAMGCVALPFAQQTLEVWMVENANKPLPTFLLRERKVGMELIRAEKRTGDGYSAIFPIREVTPEGWVRTNRGLDLKRA